MKKYKRNIFDKLNTLLFGRDLRVTEGGPFPEEYEGDFSSYYPREKYIKEQAPERLPIYDFRNFEGSNATERINSAVLKCHENGGGTVLIKDGNYTVNTVILKSNVTLFVDKSARLTASHETEKYEKEAMIFAEGCENIEITGGGVISGEGNFFGLKPVEKPMFSPRPVIDIIQSRIDYRARIRFAHMSKYGSICSISNCNNVLIHNISFENSASWTLHLKNCYSVKVFDFTIQNNRHTANADGIDINCVSDLSVRNCFVSTADDGICIKNAVYTGCTEEMHGVTVENCEVISCTNAFKIGTETTNDIHGITVRNCRFFMTDIYPNSVSGISIEAVDGSKVYDVNIKNIEMERVACPVFIRLGNRNRAAQVDENTARATELKVDTNKKTEPTDKNRFNFKSELYNISIENVTAKDIEEPIIISGFRDRNGTKYVKNVTLKNINCEYRNAPEVIDKRLFIPEYAKEYPESSRFRNLPSYRLFVRHTENLITQNINFKPAPNTWKKSDYYKDVK